MTIQCEAWQGQFGKDYTDRNLKDVEKSDDFYDRLYGITRTKLNKKFLKGVRPSSKVLEIGSNVGTMLLTLKKQGFNNLFGIDIQDYALQIGKERDRKLNLAKAQAIGLPFMDNSFDMVFTTVVLIHISPENLTHVIKEIYRCSSKYIWGFEYYAKELTEIFYGGQDDMLWAGDYMGMYLSEFKDLRVVREEKLTYSDREGMNSMFLLEKL